LEAVFFSHPAVYEAAVVRVSLCILKLNKGCSATEEEIIQFCQNLLPSFIAPRTVVFSDLPKTSGKTHKYVLREKANTMGRLYKIF